MRKENNFLDILNVFYKKINEKKINKIKAKNIRLEENIIQIKEEIKDKSIKLEKLEENFKDNNEKYKRIMEIFLSRGINFTIINKNYKLNEWENLVVNKRGDRWIIETKDGEKLKILDRDETSLLEDILKERNYSLVITRIEDKLIKVKLHVV
ncbi:hypothetical protein GCM10008905_30210 [Clostridium malenominatum]|uniref:Uncharacterized protein n=1 Tax=Clostridium malenominatum TaxID=1539 RepID=A0ABN1J671_9CLOT